MRIFREAPKPLGCNKVETNWAYTANGKFFVAKAAELAHGESIACTQLPICRGKDDFEVLKAESSERKPIKHGDPLTSDVFEVSCTAADGKVWSTVLSGIAKVNQPTSVLADDPPLINSSSLGLDVLMFAFDERLAYDMDEKLASIIRVLCWHP